MRAKSVLALGWFILLTGLFFSCSKERSSEVEYLPFRETKDGNWGLVSPDGQVLFSDLFESAPTVVHDGCFFVRNKKGYWQLYEAAAQPQQIGRQYLLASPFSKGRALVVEKDCPVTLIDTKGQTVKRLDKIAGKEVRFVQGFYQDGKALFFTADTLYGLIDHNGECVIEPEYIMLRSAGYDRYVGVSKKYKEKKSKKYTLLTAEGKVLFELSSDRYEDIGKFSDEGLIPVAVERNGKVCWGILDSEGKEVVKPSERFRKITEVRGELFIYRNEDEKYGLMNLNGETQIFAKYGKMSFLSADKLLAAKKEDGKWEYKFVNASDEALSQDTYLEVLPSSKLDGKHTIAKPDDHTYVCLDGDFKQIDKQPLIVEVDGKQGDVILIGDELNLDKFVSELSLKSHGIGDLSLSMKPKEAADWAVKHGIVTGSSDHPADDPYWYDYKESLSRSLEVQFCTVEQRISFHETMSQWTYGGYGASSYQWRDTKVYTVSMLVTPNRILKGKMDKLFHKVLAFYQKDAKVVKQNDHVKMLRRKDGTTVMVANSREGLLVQLLSDDIQEEVIKELDLSFINPPQEDDMNPRYLQFSEMMEIITGSEAADSVAAMP